MDLRVIGARAKEAASYLNSLGITEKMKACGRRPRRFWTAKKTF